MIAKLFTSTVRRVLLSQGYRLAPVDDIDTLEPLLHYLLKRRKPLTLVQIGANDGQYADPVYRFVSANHRHVRALMLEPLPDLFARLATAYRDCPSVTPINMAIHNTATEMPLYRVAPNAPADKVPSWAQGIASFDPEHHKRSRIPAEYVVTESVRCITLPALLATHQIQTLDVLQIDTEGYDAEIISGLDFSQLQPAVIHFEHGLPDRVMSPQTFHATLDRLIAHGYDVTISHYDATACHRSLFVP
jgi:FkbM family methyltransferase